MQFFKACLFQPPIDFGKKKKKPKQPVIDEIVDKVADELNDASFFDKKKKKKRADAPLRLEEGDAAVEKIEAAEPSESDATAAGASVGAATPQHPALRYPYEMLLQRIFEQLIANNPELALDVKKKLKLPPPTMARVGTKKTQFTNFTTICRSFNREPSHLSAYLFAELGTTGSMDANGALVIRGKYMAKHIEPLLQNYARKLFNLKFVKWETLHNVYDVFNILVLLQEHT